ncbi:MAG: hypothetical protein FWG66_16055 [Spirochaetes bacterium]|nr:hypothetical protein [Spirochaetota bacterium]
MRLALSVFLLSLFIFPAFSQEEDGTDAPPYAAPQEEAGEALPPHIAAGEGAVFVINYFHFDISGRTRPFAILNALEIALGQEIQGYEGLLFFIAEKEQLLVNERLFNRADLAYSVGAPDAAGRFPLDLFFTIEDTWNIIVLPRPNYSSNTGFELSLSGRDYNFLGTMHPLRLDLTYRRDTQGRSSFEFLWDSDTPFVALGLNWRFIFLTGFEYRVDSDAPVHFLNTTGLAADLPLGGTTLTLGFTESFIYNDENTDRDAPIFGDYQMGFYMSSMPFASWEIPTGVEAWRFGDLVYTAHVAGVFNHAFSRWPLAENRVGPFLVFGHSLGFERIDWIGNFRHGGGLYLENSYNHDFHLSGRGRAALNVYTAATATGHYALGGRAGVSARLMFRHWHYRDFNFNDEAGNAIRGILDRSLTASKMLSLNLDFPVRVLDFTPSVWTGNPRLRFFDFEMHISPIVDFAIFQDPLNGISFDISNTVIGYGFELMFFPAAMRSIYVRISFATNFSSHLRESPGAGDSELFFGLRHHF